MLSLRWMVADVKSTGEVVGSALRSPQLHYQVGHSGQKGVAGESSIVV